MFYPDSNVFRCNKPNKSYIYPYFTIKPICMQNNRIFGISLIAFMMIFILFSCQSEKEVHPLKKDIEELVFASGSIEWEDAYNITAQTDGVLKDVRFEIGSNCLAGTVLAQIDNPTNRSNQNAATQQLSIANENASNSAPLVQQLEQSILFAEEKYKQDQLQFVRFRKLYEAQGASKVEFENAQLAQESSYSNLQALKKQLQQAKLQAQQNLINAEMQFNNARIQETYNQVIAIEEGVVIKKLKAEGDYVRKGDVIAVLANQSDVKAVLNVDEKSIAKIKLGQQVYIRLNTNSQQVIRAQITEILSAFNEQTQSFVCKAQFNRSLNKVLFGTQLEANILVAQKKNVLVIPRSYFGYGNLVQLKGENQPHKIKPGIISSEYVEVKAGLKRDDILVPLKP